MKLLLAAGILLGLVSSACAFEGENLLVALPAGYKIGFQKKQGNTQMTEMVPAGETVENWTEMLTIQVFHGLKASADQFQAGINESWQKSCANASGLPVTRGVEKGYPVALWVLTCPLNKQTGKLEKTYMKTIQGNDSIYVVQKAFKFEPSADQIKTWSSFMKDVAVCDTRVAARACPAGIN